MSHEVLIGCKSKDRNSQRRLYEMYAGRLYATCKRYLKSEEEIEEVLADTFFIIFSKIHQLSNLDVFEAWAKKITVNECLQALRKKQKLNISIEENHIESQLTAVQDTANSEKDLLSLLQFLPEGCRMIFNLFAIEGYPHKEIAEMLSITEGTSKSQVNFARKKLQELLQLHYV